MLSVKEIKEYAIRAFSNSRGSHDWSHTERVCNLCLRIGEAEGADIEVLEIAALLHDVGRLSQDESNGMICHAEKGAEIAGNLLKDFPIPDNSKRNIIHSIQTHRFRRNNRPETIEAKVLFDADKLDSIGAIGIARAFQFAGEVGAKFHNPYIDLENTEAYSEEDTGYREFKIKLSKIRNRMLTKEGKSIAQKRHEYMERFFDKFLLEYEGGD